MKRIHFFVFTQTNEEGGFVPCGLPVESVDCTDAAQNVSCPNCIDWMSKNITEKRSSKKRASWPSGENL